MCRGFVMALYANVFNKIVNPFTYTLRFLISVYLLKKKTINFKAKSINPIPRGFVNDLKTVPCRRERGLFLFQDHNLLLTVVYPFFCCPYKSHV